VTPPQVTAATSGTAAAAGGWVQDNAYGNLLSSLPWLLVATLVLRWDWLTSAPQLGQQVGQAYGQDPFSRIIKLTMLGLSTFVVLRRISLARVELRELNIMFCAFFVLVPLSALWSISPADTLARFISLITVTQICFALTLAKWHMRRFQELMRPLVTAILAASFVVGILMPDWIIEKGEGTLKDAWHGLVYSKNGFGQLAGFGVLLWTHAWLYERKRWWRAAPPLALAAACLLLSRSSTSLLATMFSIAFLLLLFGLPDNMRRYLPFFVALFASIVLIYALAILKLIPGLDFFFSPIAALTGKDQTFTARSQIWEIIEQHIKMAPLLGTGYGAFWIGPVPTSPSYVFLARMFGFYPTESHNGYLEIVNDLGYVGLACLVGYIFVYVRQSLQLMRIERSQGVLYLGLFFQTALINLSESTWLNINTPYQYLVMTFATFAIARTLLQTSLQRHFRV
jgi:O-antigen ligase